MFQTWKLGQSEAVIVVFDFFFSSSVITCVRCQACWSWSLSSIAAAEDMKRPPPSSASTAGMLLCTVNNGTHFMNPGEGRRATSGPRAAIIKLAITPSQANKTKKKKEAEKKSRRGTVLCVIWRFNDDRTDAQGVDICVQLGCSISHSLHCGMQAPQWRKCIKVSCACAIKWGEKKNYSYLKLIWGRFDPLVRMCGNSVIKHVKAGRELWVWQKQKLEITAGE